MTGLVSPGLHLHDLRRLLTRRSFRRVVGGYGAVAVSLTVLLFVLGARATERTGLLREVYPENGHRGTPIIRDLSAGVSLEFLDTVPFVPQRFFSARWRGFWYVAESGELELHGAGDDRLDVWLDGVLVISRRPPANMHTQVRTLVVDAGVHSIWIDYEQHGGAHALSLRWARPGGPPRPFARHRLFHESPAQADIRLAHRAARLEPIVILIWALPVTAAGVFLTRRLWNSRRKALRLATVLAGAAVVLRAVLARLPGWNPESLWGDDVIYGSLIRSADFWSVIVTPVHAAPGLFVIWRWLSAVFPDPEWSLQILPFACGIAAIPTMALAARRLTGDDSLALLAAAVTALNPLLAFYTVY